MDIKLTVVIPNKDYNHYLDSAILSVTEQTVPCEVIVVDYGSEDVPAGAVSIQGSLGEARNLGISMARTDYVVTLDADDLLEPTFAEKTLQLVDEKHVVATGGCKFGESREYFIPQSGDFSKGNLILNCSVFPKRLWEDIGGFDTSMSGYEDWDFWYRAVRAGYEVRTLPESLVAIREHSDSRNKEAIRNHKQLHEYIIR